MLLPSVETLSGRRDAPFRDKTQLLLQASEQWTRVRRQSGTWHYKNSVITPTSCAVELTASPFIRKIPSCLRKPMAHSRVHKCKPLVLIVNQMNSYPILHLFMIPLLLSSHILLNLGRGIVPSCPTKTTYELVTSCVLHVPPI